MIFNIETVGVIGAGQMGAGIAEVAAQAGMTVSINDVAEERINAALATINGHLSRQVAKGQIGEAERKAILDRIKVAPTFDKLGDCDLVVEAASENEEVKRKIFIALRSSSPICPLATCRDRWPLMVARAALTRSSATSVSETVNPA